MVEIFRDSREQLIFVRLSVASEFGVYVWVGALVSRILFNPVLPKIIKILKFRNSLISYSDNTFETN